MSIRTPPPNIILDSHEFLTDTTLQAQWEQPRRKIYRHSSNEGSVVEFDYWGTPMKLFVADAKYRAAGRAYDTTPRSHGNPQLSVTTEYFNGAADKDTAALTYAKNDAWIQSTYAALKDDGTARSNTDTLMQYSTTLAAHHCRDQDIPGIGQLDLPNLYELIILYLESENIDALDPTAEANRGKALGKMNTNGRFNFSNRHVIWASTEGGSNYAWQVGYGGRAISTNVQHYYYGVAPVKEL